MRQPPRPSPRQPRTTRCCVPDAVRGGFARGVRARPPFDERIRTLAKPLDRMPGPPPVRALHLIGQNVRRYGSSCKRRAIQSPPRDPPMLLKLRSMLRTGIRAGLAPAGTGRTAGHGADFERDGTRPRRRMGSVQDRRGFVPARHRRNPSSSSSSSCLASSPRAPRHSHSGSSRLSLSKRVSAAPSRPVGTTVSRY